MNKVEQVARAICVGMGELPDTATPYSQTAKFLWHHYIPCARAAIEAMREPTDDMAHAGKETALYVLPSPALNVWRAMIDAALTQQEGE